MGSPWPISRAWPAVRWPTHGGPMRQYQRAPGAVSALPVRPAWSVCGSVRRTAHRQLPHHRKIGEGGMGVVYEGLREDIGSRAAIKVLRAEFAMKTELAARLLQ